MPFEFVPPFYCYRLSLKLRASVVCCDCVRASFGTQVCRSVSDYFVSDAGQQVGNSLGASLSSLLYPSPYASENGQNEPSLFLCCLFCWCVIFVPQHFKGRNVSIVSRLMGLHELVVPRPRRAYRHASVRLESTRGAHGCRGAGGLVPRVVFSGCFFRPLERSCAFVP